MKFLFAEIEILKSLTDEIFSAIAFWDDVVMVNEGGRGIHPYRELFFEAQDGYYLTRVSDTD